MKNIRKLLSLCLVIIMLTNTIAFGEININENIKGALLGDLETGEVLYEYNINEQLAMASVTKIMTYLVMMDAVSKGEISLDDDVVISGHAAATEGSNFGILSGETVKLSLLVKGMLIVSGNDCATAIAEHVGKTEDNFVIMMNSKASELGLLSASFVNPHGLPIDDNETGQNHMSVSDIYKLVRHILLTYPQMLEVTKEPQLVVPERNYSKTATNPILGIVEGADGLKTGYTDKAGLCLVSTMPVKGNGQDYRLVAILMGSATAEERLEKTKLLLEYGKNNFTMEKLADTSQSMDSVYITNSKLGKVDIFPAQDYSKLVNKEDIVRTKITYNQEVKAPLSKGDKIGTISILVNDEEVGQVDATVNENIEKANIFVRILRFFSSLFE
ncbi:D-alanyl-D-alanine carboxypeptidase DacF [bioreactor metagenome]|jgi:D-alanyl-D-alanine carboxypeptidase (penicillin-binding protein 5/6)|uniref:serine-type D-Ala-D-Ala carboxypeptidase n=2 Tax=root TaxID=1 RepID=A0A562JL86_9FIRM|nr:D-alanyl-D-alanine carboxypeptidase family protein [Sedimentibacter saalensis]MEA5096010.1 D-alanyl-D-alanine carboxypeptidase family protein [Sedimentibacter saalensis]TWH83908.1 D-alanyl-D-alanine carboxypeptidase (penicillin-binding protein 5/6) [Sedimentibacter saalensis]